MKTAMKLIFTMSVLLVGALSFIYVFNEREVFIESAESKNERFESVFNKIKFIQRTDRDIWMMNQSHYGRNASTGQWERLAIVVDKSKAPYQASFYQMTSGELEWSDALLEKRTPYRANCFTCHNNGPRAIRPEASSYKKLSMSEKMILLLWNLKIKTYGRIHYNPIHDEEDKVNKVVFRKRGIEHNDVLKVKTCMKCHTDSGLFSRGSLVRQQRGTIEYLVENGQMPPKGFLLNQKEQAELRDFVRGF